VSKTASVWIAACVLMPLVSASFGQAPNAGARGPGTAPAGAVAGSAQPPAARGPSLKLALEAAQKALDTCKGLDQKIGVTVVDSAGV
jgi:hypothetical protein